MPRLSKPILFAACLALLAAAPVRAQWLAEEGWPLERAAPTAPSAAVSEPAVPAHLAALPVPAQAVERRGTPWGTRLLRAAGGAVVGAWVGYVGSQVIHSDWDKDSNSDFSEIRTRYTGGGAGVGALLGLVLRGGSGGMLGSPVAEGSGVRVVTPTGGSNVLVREEIARTGIGNAYDVIQSLRPNWLRSRGAQSLHERGSIQGTSKTSVAVSAGRVTLQAYLDGARLEHADALKNVPTSDIQSIEYFDGPAASLRFGPDNSYGAILVTTARGKP